MLESLQLRQFTLIESLDLTFPSGFIVLTGETGAGKSILFDAIGLVLGERAASGLIRRGAEQATVQAVFRMEPNKGSHIASVLEQHGCPPDNETLTIRRIINVQGRNRVFINGTLSSLRTLIDLSTSLVRSGIMDLSN